VAQLTSDEQTAITLASDYLKKAEQSENPAAIREATLILDHATRRFAELMMDAAVSSALRGKDHGIRRRGVGRGCKPRPMPWPRPNSNERRVSTEGWIL